MHDIQVHTAGRVELAGRGLVQAVGSIIAKLMEDRFVWSDTKMTSAASHVESDSHRWDLSMACFLWRVCYGRGRPKARIDWLNVILEGTTVARPGAVGGNDARLSVEALSPGLPSAPR